MKSRTRRTSANTSTKQRAGESGLRSGTAKPFATKRARAPAELDAAVASFGETLAVGHQPPATLTPSDETLFRAFQSNLLSLVSHELRTPLTGILNALSVLEDGGGMGEFSNEELVRMARQNAQRLHRTLLTLLDLASLESGTFHVRLREIDLNKLVASRLDAHQSIFRDQKLKVERASLAGAAVLADAQKLSRAVDLCFQALLPRVKEGSEVRISAQANHVEIRFELTGGTESAWSTAWSQAIAGFQSGIASPTSAFAGVLQSEQAFLSRMEEGLGSEFMLIHEILRQHQGRFTATQKGPAIALKLEIPILSSEEGLRAVLTSRAYEASSELRSVTLVLIHVPDDVKRGADTEAFAKQVKSCFFRASDAVYLLPDVRKLALVLDDCRPEYVPVLVARIEKAISREAMVGVAHCPLDGHDPERLLDLAKRRLEISRAE